MSQKISGGVAAVIIVIVAVLVIFFGYRQISGNTDEVTRANTNYWRQVAADNAKKAQAGQMSANTASPH